MADQLQFLENKAENLQMEIKSLNHSCGCMKDENDLL